MNLSRIEISVGIVEMVLERSKTRCNNFELSNQSFQLKMNLSKRFFLPDTWLISGIVESFGCRSFHSKSEFCKSITANY